MTALPTQLPSACRDLQSLPNVVEKVPLYLIQTLRGGDLLLDMGRYGLTRCPVKFLGKAFFL